MEMLYISYFWNKVNGICFIKVTFLKALMEYPLSKLLFKSINRIYAFLKLLFKATMSSSVANQELGERVRWKASRLSIWIICQVVAALPTVDVVVG